MTCLKSCSLTIRLEDDLVQEQDASCAVTVLVFFDTYGLVSALLARGFCAEPLRLALTEHTRMSRKVVVDEWRHVLGRIGGLLPAQIVAIRCDAKLPAQPIERTKA